MGCTSSSFECWDPSDHTVSNTLSDSSHSVTRELASPENGKERRNSVGSIESRKTVKFSPVSKVFEYPPNSKPNDGKYVVYETKELGEDDDWSDTTSERGETPDQGDLSPNVSFDRSRFNSDDLLAAVDEDTDYSTPPEYDMDSALEERYHTRSRPINRPLSTLHFDYQYNENATMVTSEEDGRVYNAYNLNRWYDQHQNGFVQDSYALPTPPPFGKPVNGNGGHPSLLLMKRADSLTLFKSNANKQSQEDFVSYDDESSPRDARKEVISFAYRTASYLDVDMHEQNEVAMMSASSSHRPSSYARDNSAFVRYSRQILDQEYNSTLPQHLSATHLSNQELYVCAQ